MSTIIDVSDLSFRYSQTQVLHDLTFQVTSGSFLTIAGPNGAGKSTILNLLSGLLTQNSGTIQIDNAPIQTYSRRDLAKQIAVVRQEFVPVFGFSVAQTVMMARTPYYSSLGFESPTDRKLVKEALRATDTEQFAARLLAELSGGERQRVFIARALAQDTPILLLDEPTSFLDLKHQVGIYDLLKKMQLEKGKTIVTITHDINLAAQYSDETLLLANDGTYHVGSVESVLSLQQVEKVFAVRTFAGTIGQRKFFLPLGKFAKDSELLHSDQNRPSEDK